MIKGKGKEECYKGLSNFLFYLSHGTTNNETNNDREVGQKEKIIYFCLSARVSFFTCNTK